MYTAFYNFQRNPFEITPDPSFLFPTERHNEALGALYYGIRWHKGIVVLTGEVGTGKTLLLRCLLQFLKQSPDVAYAYLFNSCLSATEFLQYVVRDFRLPTAGRNKGDLLFDLCNFVVNRGLNNLTTVLIVDEAHHLSTKALEEVRLLTNLETAERKLLQIVLVGQPELDDKLNSVELRQLKQRISTRCRLLPLDLAETKGYIQRRLHLVGANSHAETLFPTTTIEAVYRHSRGIPRLINTICENALIFAYAKRMRQVAPQMIDDVADALQLHTAARPECGSTGVPEEAELQRVAKTLLDLYASLQKTSKKENELAPAITTRVRQA